jgi:hypothetical protein
MSCRCRLLAPTASVGYGLDHWLIFVVMVAVLLYPIGRILARIGLSPFWSILALIPFVNLIALWFLAFINWPERESEARGNAGE